MPVLLFKDGMQPTREMINDPEWDWGTTEKRRKDM